MEAADVATLLRGALADAQVTWSLGSFGALAEFMRDEDEAVRTLPDARMGLATARGAIALSPSADLRPVAYETGFSDGYNHAVALCLPESACAMNGRSVVTELGPDQEAARAEDREAILFDLGLGLLAVDACLRASDPEAVACLRAGVGRPFFAPDNPIGPRLVAMSLHRIFLARIGRIEVYAPIPAPGGMSPEGPHTHVLPKLLRAGRTHAATTPIPDGFVPCAGMHPPHPYKDGSGRRIPFDTARHAAFQILLDRWGDPDLLAVKRGMTPSKAVSPKHAQSARRVAELQARFLRGGSAEAMPGDKDETAAEHT
ncbi:DUF6925 family protein [Methylobacterium sp. R2-1]|uniref:DUF6925 family protein n=1 Tax=Methylobacterium sp. R2-1 TaxID=2587064 RepID=UPI00161C4402|nr:hypothetical protein [Methylobacterium sp. R2-1]MBB2964124.1 hypothetical protein [Methylobacterium sp. R2-1]